MPEKRVPSDEYMMRWLEESSFALETSQRVLASRFLPDELRQAIAEWNRKLRHQRADAEQEILRRMREEQ